MVCPPVASEYSTVELPPNEIAGELVELIAVPAEPEKPVRLLV